MGEDPHAALGNGAGGEVFGAVGDSREARWAEKSNPELFQFCANKTAGGDKQTRKHYFFRKKDYLKIILLLF